jgi:Putative restriction endonuclease
MLQVNPCKGKSNTMPTLTKALTLDEFLNLPETKPAGEYIDGQIIQKPMPKGKHSAIQGEFVPAINNVVKAQCIARAFPELRCTFGDRSIVPDIAVFSWQRIPRDENGEVANVFARLDNRNIVTRSRPDKSYKKYFALLETWHSYGLVGRSCRKNSLCLSLQTRDRSI